MIDQTLFNTLADEIVADGKRVSYSRIRKALKKRNCQPGQVEGKAASDRDLQDPYARWRALRGYKGHLATLHLPETMEKLIASFVAQALEMAELKVEADHEKQAAQALERTQDRIDDLTSQIAVLAEENRRLQQEMAILRQAALTANAAGPKGGGRSLGGTKTKGIPASTAHHFWDRVALRVAAEIRKNRKPMSIDELVDAIDDETKILADAAFETINTTVLAKRLKWRVDANRYRLHMEGGLYRLKKVKKDATGPRKAA